MVQQIPTLILDASHNGQLTDISTILLVDNLIRNSITKEGSKFEQLLCAGTRIKLVERVQNLNVFVGYLENKLGRKLAPLTTRESH